MKKKLTTITLATLLLQQEAARIFISVSKTDARTLFDNNILSKKDPRVRKTPFMTARPTLNETKRTIAKLLSVTTTGIEIVEKKKKEVKKTTTTMTTTESKIKAKVDAEMRNQLEQQQKQVAEAKKIVEAPEPELHKASRTGDVEALTEMLESACLNLQTGDGDDTSVDPSVPWRGKTAYLVAKDGETRDAFRRAYFKYPDAFDWESRCDVPSMLTPEMELKREEKEKEFEEKKKKKEAERKKALKAKKKASASALLAAEEENMKSAASGKKSSSSIATSAKDLLASEKNAADERRRTMVRRLFLSPITLAQTFLSYRLRRRRDAPQQQRQRRRQPGNSSSRHQRRESSKATIAQRSEEESAFKEFAFKLGFAAFALVALSKSVQEGKAKKKRE